MNDYFSGYAIENLEHAIIISTVQKQMAEESLNMCEPMSEHESEIQDRIHLYTALILVLTQAKKKSQAFRDRLDKMIEEEKIRTLYPSTKNN